MRHGCILLRAAFTVLLMALPLCSSLAQVRKVFLPEIASAQNQTNTVQADRTIPVGSGIVREIEFVGLRRISPAALRPHIRSQAGEQLVAALVEEDVRALDRLGWFDEVTAVAEPIPVLLAFAESDPAALFGNTENLSASGLPPFYGSGRAGPGLRLVFLLKEKPFLAGVDFHGSRVLSSDRAREILAEEHLSPRLAQPVNRATLHSAARVLEAALADMGHPQACVVVRFREAPRAAAVRARFEIRDGPRLPAGEISFTGVHAFAEKKLRREMKRVAPDALLAGLRDKEIYTPARLNEDLARVAGFYQNHGYPDVRLGEPRVEVRTDRVRRWFPWPHHSAQNRIHIAVPVEEGRRYRVVAAALALDTPMRNPAAPSEALALVREFKPGEPFSQAKIEQVRDALSHLRALGPKSAAGLLPEVDAVPKFDRTSGTAQIRFQVRYVRPYVVRRLIFTGQRRFSDTYYRRRIGLGEGKPFDAARLEEGLARLARAGFVRPARPQDIRVQFNEAHHTADVQIHLDEIGRQRFSLVGGRAGLGSTLGIVYNVFDLLGGEELLTAHLEGGPESLQIALALAKEGLFGTRASLGLTLFQDVIRPNLPGAGGRRRLFTSRSTGFGLSWSQPVSASDTLGINYVLSSNSTEYRLPALPAMPGSGTPAVPPFLLRTTTRSRSVGLSETRLGPRQRLETSTSISGGWLGGDENVLRSSLEYLRVQGGDTVFNQDPQSALVFRGYLAGVASHKGPLPFSSLLFPGDEQVRGFRPGELAPYAVIQVDHPDGTTTYSVQSSGANLAGGINAEYRKPLTQRTELAAFFDIGSGWLLPGWLGEGRPALLTGTNGRPRASLGLELRWRLPGLDQPLRLHYAFNPLRLARSLVLPDGSRFHPPDRLTAFGWALGGLF